MPASNKEFRDIQATRECGFILKRVRDMIRIYSQKYVIVVVIATLKGMVITFAS